MKKTLTLFFVLIFTISCYNNDEKPDEYISLNVQDLIIVNALPQYKTGDVLTIETVFSKLQKEPGQNTLLDIYKTTQSKEFGYSFTLEKKVFNGNYLAIDLLSSDFVKDGKGKLTLGAFPMAICLLNENNNLYEFKQGLILNEPGFYSLRFNQNIKNVSFQNNFRVDIFTGLKDNNSSQLFFEVK